MPLSGALGRILAAPVTALDDVPGFDNSAMDGYAVRAVDLGAAADHPIALTSPTSRAPAPPLRRARRRRGDRDLDRRRGSGRRRHRGPGRGHAPRRRSGRVRWSRSGPGSELASGRRRHRARSAAARGRRDARPGRARRARLGGQAEVELPASSQVSFVRTGDELIGVGETPPAGAFATPTLTRCRRWHGGRRRGGEQSDRAADDPAATGEALAAGLDADVARRLRWRLGRRPRPRQGRFEELGVEQVFWGVSLKPGKPT